MATDVEATVAGMHHPNATTTRRQPRLLSVAFALLGIGVMCPWNAFINARPYFEARLCQESSGSFTSNIEVWFSVLYNVASVVSLVVLLLLQYLYQPSCHDASVRSLLHSSLCHPMSLRSPSLRRRSCPSTDFSAQMVLIPLFVYLAVFLFTTVLVFFPAAPAMFVLYATLVGLFLCGVCTSVASAGIIGTAGLFDADVGVGPYFQGQAAGGLIVALVNAAATWSNDPMLYQRNVCQNLGHETKIVSHSRSVCIPYDTINYSTGAYFLLNCFILLCCIAGYLYVNKKKQELKVQEYSPVMDVSSECMRKMDSTTSSSSSSSVEVHAYEDDEKEAERSFQAMIPKQNETSQEQSVMAVWKTVRLPALALFLTYLVTLATFPVITSDLTSAQECRSSSRIRNDLFVPLTFLIFNLGDLLGRFVVADDGVEKRRNELPSKLVWASMARLAFVPLFLFCFSRKSMYKDIAVHNDIFSWMVQLAMAVSNGVLTTVSFSVVATLVPPDETMQQVASSILNLSLCLGLVAGGLAASPLLWLYTGQW
uniref:Uncharacterized protein n=1 Tax=Amphora coffeiformis TaxID=265554 RepID=A0A7S3LES5_9STRA